MALKYLGGASWAQVTREERFFCAHLVHLIREHGLGHFLGYLNDRHGAGLDAAANWELAYEACFYRDLHHHRGGKGTLFSPKRTFDLALLSDNAIVIIEAKAHGQFEDEQLRSFDRDREQVTKETGVASVVVSALHSSLYTLPAQVASRFDGPRLTWAELAILFEGDPILARADAIHKPSALGTYGRNNLGGSMTGTELLACHQRGEDFWIGRGGGLRGSKLSADIASGTWAKQQFETNRDAAEAPNRNWFRLTKFMQKLGVER